MNSEFHPHQSPGINGAGKRYSDAQRPTRYYCFLCDSPKYSWAILLEFTEPVCRGCVNYEGSERVEWMIDQTRHMKRAYYSMDPRLNSGSGLSNPFHKPDISDHISHFAVPVRPDNKHKLSDFQTTLKEEIDRATDVMMSPPKMPNGQHMPGGAISQFGSSGAKFSRRGSLPPFPQERGALNRHAWPKNPPGMIKPQKELQELTQQHGTGSPMAHSLGLRENAASPPEGPGQSALAAMAAAVHQGDLTSSKNSHGARSSKKPPISVSASEPSNSANERLQLSGSPGRRASPPTMVKCRLCSKVIDNANYIQCPSVVDHRFCFRCCKEMVSKATEDCPATCPSGNRCAAPHIDGNVAWTFSPTEARTILEHLYSEENLSRKP